jgi:hypothetical protein
MATTTAAVALPRSARATSTNGIRKAGDHVSVECTFHNGALDEDAAVIADLMRDRADRSLLRVELAHTECQIGVAECRAAIGAARRGESSALPANAPPNHWDPTPASSDLSVSREGDRVRFTSGGYWVELPQARAEAAIAALSGQD